MIILLLLCQIDWQAINRPYSDTEQELIIQFSLPGDQLHTFMKDDEVYSEYEVQVTVFDAKNKQLHGDYWERTFLTMNEEIEDSVRIYVSKKSDYYILRIIDLHGGLMLSEQGKIIVIKYIGNITWDFHDDTVSVNFSVLNTEGEVDSIDAAIEDNRVSKHLRTGEYTDSLIFDVTNLPNGSYNMLANLYFRSLRIDGLSVPVQVTRIFFLDEITWAERVEQLEYIASSSEIRAMKSAMTAERESLWHAFWKPLDPTPNTAFNEKELEYYERIDYCEENFSHGDRGWRSDRARIYVTYGPPDEIQAYPYHLGPPKSVANPVPTLYDAYIVWIYYRNNREFVFGDKHGLGEYILISGGF
jgi:GWxTD domain-containing protein